MSSAEDLAQGIAKRFSSSFSYKASNAVSSFALGGLVPLFLRGLPFCIDSLGMINNFLAVYIVVLFLIGLISLVYVRYFRQKMFEYVKQLDGHLSTLDNYTLHHAVNKRIPQPNAWILVGLGSAVSFFFIALDYYLFTNN